MHIARILGNCVGLGLIRRKRLLRIRMEREHEKHERIREKLGYRQRKLKDMLRYPVMEVTLKELQNFPKAGSFDFHTCPLGTWFLFPPNDILPGTQILGQVVEGLDMFADQWGAGISIPERGVNCYRISVVADVADVAGQTS